MSLFDLIPKQRELRHEWMASLVSEAIRRQIIDNRKHRGWSQNDLAKRAGLNQSAISRLEGGKGNLNVTLNTLAKIAAAFDCALIVRFCSYGEFIDFIIDGSGIALSLAEDKAFLSAQADAQPANETATPERLTHDPK